MPIETPPIDLSRTISGPSADLCPSAETAKNPAAARPPRAIRPIRPPRDRIRRRLWMIETSRDPRAIFGASQLRSDHGLARRDLAGAREGDRPRAAPARDRPGHGPLGRG